MTAAIQIRLSDAHCPQKSSRSAGPEDDAEIREVRRAAACAVRGVCLLRAACQHVFFAKSWQESQGQCEDTEIRSGKQSTACPAHGVCLFAGVFALMCSSQKTGRRTRGRCENTEIRSGSLSIACPVQGVRFYKRTCRMRFSAQKNPPAGKPGDFYQAFAVRWVFSRAITTGGISTS